MTKPVSTLDDVYFLNLRTFSEEKGSLVPIEALTDCNLDLKRIFYVYNVPVGDVRGRHAHLQTKQLLICMKGRCTVSVHDGQRECKYVLEEPNKALLVPTMIWAQETYDEKDSLLVVLCDSHYDPKDYIWDFNQFCQLKKERKG